MPAALLLFALAVAAPAQAAEAPEQIFLCSFGARQVEVVRDGATLTYRFGRPRFRGARAVQQNVLEAVIGRRGTSPPLHPPCPPLYRAPHHSLSEQGTPSRSALNALIGWGFTRR
jgi:hypothetical protein